MTENRDQPRHREPEPESADDAAHAALPAEALPEFPVPSRDPRAIAEAIRTSADVALSQTGAVVLLRHADVIRAAHDPQTFSSAVSAHLQLPNGLDGEEHAAYRRLIEPYFTPERMSELEPRIRTVAREICTELSGSASGAVRCDAVSQLGAVFAVRAQTAWLGWPSFLEPELLDWVQENWSATRSGERTRTAAAAQRFDEIIRSVLLPRRAESGIPAGVPAVQLPAAVRSARAADVTAELIADTTLGRTLSDEELVSILRNWTGGDLGSIALCTGVILAGLAENRPVQDRLRSGVSAAERDAIIDELLRLDDPFVANRRITTCPVTIGGARLPAGQRVVLDWTSANLDEHRFADPQVFAPEDNAWANLVYGTGPHVCPGRPLAALELGALVEEVLAAFSDIALQPGGVLERESTPVGGFASVPVLLTPA